MHLQHIKAIITSEEVIIIIVFFFFFWGKFGIHQSLLLHKSASFSSK